MSIYTVMACITEGDEHEVSEHGTFDNAMNTAVDHDDIANLTHPDLYYFVTTTKRGESDRSFYASDYYDTHGSGINRH